MSTKQGSTEKTQHRQALKKISKITAIVTAAVILAAAVILITAVGIAQSKAKNGEYLRRETAAAAGDTELNAAVMSVIFHDNARTLSPYLGVDPDTSLKRQYISDGRTVFELFTDVAKNDARELLSVCEAAKAAGFALSKEELDALQRRADQSELSGYPAGISKDDIRDALLLRALAAKYEAAKKTELAPKTDELQGLLDEDSGKYLYFDTLAFSVYYSDGSNGASDTGAVFTRTQAKAHADALAGSADAAQFRETVKRIILDGTPHITEDELNEYMSALEYGRMKYTEGDEVAEWAFDTALGSTHTVADADACTYTVYLLTREPYLDTSPTESFRIILLSDSDHGSHSKTVTAANEFLSRLRESGFAPDVFSLLAMEHSTDSMSYLVGGLYENMEKGVMLGALEDYIFAPERKAGDSAVIDIDGGCALVYCEGDRLCAWEAAVLDDALAKRYDSHCQELLEMYPVLFDENVLDMIPA